jgi:pentatricopeptide repeat protein
MTGYDMTGYDMTFDFLHFTSFHHFFPSLFFSFSPPSPSLSPFFQDLLAQQHPDAHLDTRVVEAAMRGFNRVGHPDRAMELFSLLQSKRVPVSTGTCIAALRACRDGDFVTDAADIFQAMKQAGVVTTAAYEHMMSIRQRVGDSKGVIALFREMLTCQNDRVEPNRLTYCLLFPACHNWQQLVAAVNEMKRSGLTPSANMYTSLIIACSTMGRADEAMDLFHEMKDALLEPDIVTYTTLISMCSTAHRNTTAIALFEEMKLAGLQPNMKTYSALICAYANARKLEDALEVFSIMRSLDIAPDAIAYNRVIAACGKCRDANEAMRLFGDMKRDGLEPGPDTYATLLATCRAMGQNAEAAALEDEMRDAIYRTVSTLGGAE